MRNYFSPAILVLLLLSGCATDPGFWDAPPEPANPGMVFHKPQRTVTPDVPSPEKTEPAPAPVTADSKHQDIWVRIQQNLTIPRNLSHPTTQTKLKFYASKQEFLDRVADRATPYLYHIVEELEKRNLPLDLALLPIVESAYQPFAHSPSRAAGIWQFIPGTGKLYGLKQNWWYDGRRDIVAATDAALRYLQKLHDDFNGDWLLALAAYNAGEGNVGRAVEKSLGRGKSGDFWSLHLTEETLGYVPSLMAVAEIIANPEKYNITLKPIPNKPYFEKIDAGSQIDLATVSELSGLTMDEIYTLNPGINKWATDPEGPHYFLIPVDRAASFKQKLAALPADQRIKMQAVEIKQGDSLGSIARRYRTDINTLKQINNLRSNNIHAGHMLLIPSSQQPISEYTLSQDVRTFDKLKPSGDGQSFTYTIKSGDNLWDISQSYGVTIEQLCAWNGISKNTVLSPGRKLTLWAKETPEVVPVVAHTVTTIADKQEHITYTVRAGDSLWLIAQRYGVTVAQLQKWNGLSHGSSLQPGQTLDIYTGTPPADV